MPVGATVPYTGNPCWTAKGRAARPRLFRGRGGRKRNPNTERPPTLRESGAVRAERGRLSRVTMDDDERSGGAQHAKGWSGDGQRSIAAVAEQRSDECDGADDGSDGVQDA
eukprot:gene14076-biopygen11295